MYLVFPVFTAKKIFLQVLQTMILVISAHSNKPSFRSACSKAFRTAFWMLLCNYRQSLLRHTSVSCVIKIITQLEYGNYTDEYSSDKCKFFNVGKTEMQIKVMIPTVNTLYIKMFS